jgi:hypothetical protein
LLVFRSARVLRFRPVRAPDHDNVTADKSAFFLYQRASQNPDVALDLSLDKYISAECEYAFGPVFDHDRFAERKNLHFRGIVDNYRLFIDRGNRIALGTEDLRKANYYRTPQQQQLWNSLVE